MNNRIYTTGEVLTINTNLREIEKNLGYPIPGGCINVDELKDHVLRPGEILTVCENLKFINKRYNKKVKNRYYTDIGDLIFFYAILGIGALSLLFGWF